MPASPLRLAVATAAALLAAACASVPPPARFDVAHAETALAYFETSDPALIDAIAATPAAAHLARHAEIVESFPAGTTAREITDALLAERPSADDEAAAHALFAYVDDNPERQAACVAEAVARLPVSARDPAPQIYLTWGYDIGVATDLGASLNLAHRHFRSDPDELWFYCIHEAHHAGVMRLHPLVDIGSVETLGAFSDLVRYLTYLEGTATAAAYDARRDAGALDADEDYVALRDPARLAAISARYEELAAALDARAARAPDAPTTDADWAILDEMSSGERLWYRHGARMAMAIEAARGRAGYLAVIEAGPDAFFAAYAAATAP